MSSVLQMTAFVKAPTHYVVLPECTLLAIAPVVGPSGNDRLNPQLTPIVRGRFCWNQYVAVRSETASAKWTLGAEKAPTTPAFNSTVID
jgi:hypothetical protein